MGYTLVGFPLCRTIFQHKNFDLDTCAMEHNTKVKNFITPEQDTLTTDWQGRYCWMNPPYSNPLRLCCALSSKACYITKRW